MRGCQTSGLAHVVDVSGGPLRDGLPSRVMSKAFTARFSAASVGEVTAGLDSRQRLLPLGTVFGSNAPSRSLGTVVFMGPKFRSVPSWSGFRYARCRHRASCRRSHTPRFEPRFQDDCRKLMSRVMASLVTCARAMMTAMRKHGICLSS